MAALPVVAAPLALLVGGVAPSGADTSPATGGWYWAGQPGAQPPPVGQPPAVPAPDVPAGDVAAGYRPTGIDKATFLHLANEVSSGVTVTSVVLTIKEDSAGGNLAADQGKVNAVLVDDFWVDGAAGTSLDQAPKYEASPSVAGTRGSDGTWTFDLTPIAQQWANGAANNGIGLIPDQSGGTFQVVWNVSSAAVDVQSSSSSSQLNFVAPGSSSDGSTTSGGTGAPSGSLPSDTGSSSSFTPSSAPLGGDGTFTPATDGTAPATASQSTPAAPAAPAASAGNEQQVALSPRAKRAASHTGIPAGFFLVGLAALGVLGGVSVILGDMGEPDLPREGSVVRRLERRAAPIR